MIYVLAAVVRNIKTVMEKTNIKSSIFELFESFLISIILISGIYLTIGFPTLIIGPSMEPTYMHGERVIVDRITKLFKNLKTGEVIVFKSTGQDVDLIKRVVAEPGDVIKVLDCKIYITRGSEKLSLGEPYLYKDTCTKGSTFLKEGRSIKVPEDEYFVMGDNRDHSLDSRVFGPIKKDQILGRVIFRFWPFDRSGFLE